MDRVVLWPDLIFVISVMNIIKNYYNHLGNESESSANAIREFPWRN